MRIKKSKKMNKEQRLKALLSNPYALQRELNNRSLEAFLEFAWSELTSQPYVGNWHITYLCTQLEFLAKGVGNRQKKIHDLLINIPPGSTKTILCSIVFPVWCWTKWPWMRFITASYSGDLAYESATYSRDLVKSDKFKAYYPEIGIKGDKDTKGNFRIVTYKPHANGRGIKEIPGGNRYSTSVGGTLTGFHGDILIWDDALNPQQATSEREMEKANEWVDQTLSSRKTNKANSVTIGIMQRLHENDPSGHLLKKKKKNLKWVCIPGEIRNYAHLVRPRVLRKFYKNDLFDANRLDWNVLKEMETDMGQYGYSGQIGQHPVPPKGGMFHVDSFQMIPGTQVPMSEIIKTVRYWDKAASDGKGTYSVGVKMSRLKGNRLVIWDVKRGQWSTNKREKIIRQTALADGHDCHVVVEQEPGSGGKESAENTIRNLIGYVTKADAPTGKKEFRADPFSVTVNNGDVYMVVADWNKDFKEELRHFPFSTYKDQTDASSGAFNYLVTKKEARRIA